MAAFDLVSRAIPPIYDLNWRFLVLILASAILATTFLFYFNRLIASVLSHGIRIFTWRKYQIYIDIESIQFSLLAGRVFFKGLRYHGHNETIVVADGYVTWRYWLRRVQEVDLPKGHETKHDSESEVELGSRSQRRDRPSRGRHQRPCRIELHLRGLEWFVYNRSPAYETVLEGAFGAVPIPSQSAESSNVRYRTKRAYPRHHSTETLETEFLNHKGNVDRTNSASCTGTAKEVSSDGSKAIQSANTKAQTSQQPSSYATKLPTWLEFLPIEVHCSKAGLVIGNMETQSVLTGKCERIDGHITIASTGPMDLYKQIITLEVKHPLIQLKGNQLAKDSSMQNHSVSRNSSQVAPKQSLRLPPFFRRVLRKVLPTRLAGRFNYEQHKLKSTAKGDDDYIHLQHRWLGLDRYLDREDDRLEQERWKNIEYARLPNILEAPSIAIDVHWDAPGPVSPDIEDARLGSTVSSSNINGSEPPDWGIDIRIRGGNLTYGPWADRQRTGLQAMFFPSLLKDTLPHAHLIPGQTRISTHFKLLIEFEDQTTLRIPTRESSKDSQWRGKAVANASTKSQNGRKDRNRKDSTSLPTHSVPDSRPLGWVDINIAKDSTASFVTDLVANETGFMNHLAIDLRNPELTTSVNHGLFCKAESQVISCYLPNPLKWNDLHEWDVSILGKTVEVFLLRDHFYLINDLIGDWNAETSGDYYTFIPYLYNIKFQIEGLKMFLNVNESNIINNPASLEDNNFVVFKAVEVAATAGIDNTAYRPLRSSVKFEGDIRRGAIDLCTSRRNTYNAFLERPTAATLKQVQIKGGFTFNTSTSPGLTDFLSLDIHGEAPRIVLYGFLIRYIMKIKDNYFGDDIHFRTFDEFQKQKNNGAPRDTETSTAKQHHRLSNDLDVVVRITTDRASGFVPCAIYSTAETVKLDMSSVAADLRFTAHFMDLSVVASPVSLSCSSFEESTPGHDQSSATELFVDGLEIYGHRLFGLPPTEPTYVCNWDFEIGAITGECSLRLAGDILKAGRAFAFTFDDVENTLKLDSSPIIHDITFLRVHLSPSNLWIQVEEISVMCQVGEISLEFNDWAKTETCQTVHLDVTDLRLALVNTAQAMKSSSSRDVMVKPSAYLHFAASISTRKSIRAGSEIFRLQQQHVREQDKRTNRMPWLCRPSGVQISSFNPWDQMAGNHPASTVPPMPAPVNYTGHADRRDFSERAMAYGNERSNHFREGRPHALEFDFLSTRPSAGAGLVDARANRRPRPGSPRLPSRTQLAELQQPYEPFTNNEPNRKPKTSGFGFSSPYKRPYFALLSAKLDLSDVPSFHSVSEVSSSDLNTDSDAGSVTEIPSSESGTTGILIEFGPQTQMLCTTTALDLFTKLMRDRRLQNPVEKLDDLHMDLLCKLQDTINDFSEPSHHIFRVSTGVIAAKLVIDGYSHEGKDGVPVAVQLQSDRLVGTTRTWGSVITWHVQAEEMTFSTFGSSTNKNAENQRTTLVRIASPVMWMSDIHSGSRMSFESPDIFFEVDARWVLCVPSVFEKGKDCIKGLTQSLDRYSQNGRMQLQRLVASLIAHGEGIPDAAFLASGTYITRLTPKHVRKSDSWKMLSRLRQILRYSTNATKEAIYGEYSESSTFATEDLATRVLRNFEQWRTWDLLNVNKSLLLKHVFKKPHEDEPEKRTLDFTRGFIIQIHRCCIQIRLDTIQNELLTERLFICLEQSSAAEKGTPASAVRPPRRLQVSVHRTLALIKWNLVLFVIWLSRSVNLQAAITTQDLVAVTYRGRPQIQLLLSLDFLLLTLRTTNTQSDLICRRLLACGSQASDASKQLTMAADTMELKVAGGSRKLLVVNFQKPRMASSAVYQTLADSEPSKALISGLCEHIHAQLAEEPLALIRFARQVMTDEVKDVEKTMESTFQSSRVPKISGPASKRKTTEFVQVVLIVNSYTLLAKILPSLHYKLDGKAAKGKLEIVLDVDLEVKFHYDVFRYIHSFNTSADPRSDSISLFAFPPMFGHVRLNKNSQNILVFFKGLVEAIHFDAHSVHALLVMINRPETASFASRLQDEAQSLTGFRREQPVRDEPDEPPKGSSSTVSYDMTINITGIHIDANVPQSNSSLSKVGLQVGSEGLYLKAKNTESTARVGSMPDVQVKAMRSGARLYRFEGNKDCTAGTLRIQAVLQMTAMRNEAGVAICLFRLQSKAFEAVAQATSAPVLTAILGHLQDTMKKIDLNQEVSTLRKIRHPSRVVRADLPDSTTSKGSAANQTSLRSLLNASYVLEMQDVRAIWEIGDSIPMSPIRQAEDLVFSISRVAFATRGANVAQLSLRDVELQITPWKQSSGSRSANSALLPEVVFNVAYQSDVRNRQLAFQAAGKSLDLRLTSRFILPVSDLRRSIAQSVQQVHQITEHWHKSTLESGSPRKSILGERRLTSLQIDADFAGAVVHLHGTKQTTSPKKASAILRATRTPQRGHMDQFTSEDTTPETSLRSPGIAFNVHYRDSGEGPKSLSAETRVNASSNTLHPRIIPVIREISSSIKEMTSEQSNEAGQDSSYDTLSSSEGSARRSADPSTVFGDCQINLGLRICKQDFGLTCQPYAKVAATAHIDEIYIIVNSVKSQYKDQAYNLSATLKHLTVGVQHAYSRESTVTFGMRSVFLSLMSNQDAEGIEGLSVILRIDPTKATVNARQVQDVLLFRDIWMPPAERGTNTQPEVARSPESFPVMIQRYQQVSTATTMPWNVVVLMSELDIQLDLGQSLGKSTVLVSHGWMSSRKSSQAEQNLCFGLKSIVIQGLGRMSGLLELHDLRIRTSIRWPHTKVYSQQTPLIQASFHLDEIRIKAGLDYQTFAVAVISGLGLFMYNVRRNQGSSNDHLLAMVDGKSIQVYLTTLSASQALALWQAGQRFIAEKQAAYQASLAEVERNLQRRPSLMTGQSRRSTSEPMSNKQGPETSLQLRTEVVVAIGSVNFGAFPSTFSDNQIFKLETLDVAAKFSCTLRDARLLSTLSLQLGRLRISLSPVVRPSVSTAITDLTIDDLISSATRSQGGVILRVPMVIASMQTWQDPGSTHIDYTFRSSFQGKVDVGWSYARVSFIRGMWNSHARALAQRLGKPLPKSAVQISGGPQPEGSEVASAPDASNKITAVISVPISKYTYTALEPPLIETPQLRDMGEATPPLEWIGLHRERLPNVTHQIVIVSLLEVAKEVEDAYTRILGSSSV